MKKRAVIASSVLWGILALSSLPLQVLAQGGGGTTPATPNGKMTTPAPASSATSVATNAASGIHGNKKTHVYHLATCPGYAKVSAKNLATFSTEDEAMKAGFHKAKNCPK